MPFTPFDAIGAVDFGIALAVWLRLDFRGDFIFRDEWDAPR